uniref:Caspase-8 n=1 Tax=Nothobranchius kadleci TaxID=1051664 RepID=A0A1A8D3S2_NOTKA
MDRYLLSRIDDDLESSEVAELCFLCGDVVSRKRLEGIVDAKGLFMRLEEKGLLDNPSFLCQLLQTIHRADLTDLLEANSRPQEETDALPVLSQYRVMLYTIHEDMTTESLDKMKYLLNDKLNKRQLEMSSTALGVFAEMEKMGIISKSNVTELHGILSEFDQQLALTVQNYMNRVQHLQRPPLDVSSHGSIDQQRPNSMALLQNSPCVCETQPNSTGPLVCCDLSSETEFYLLTHVPRGRCVIINNMIFPAENLSNRRGSEKDEEALSELFQRFGFEIELFSDLDAEQLNKTIKTMTEWDYSQHDLLVVCILTHGELGCIFGTDGGKVLLRDLISNFWNDKVPSLSGKPKVFFIQACQGDRYQEGATQGPVQEESLACEPDSGSDDLDVSLPAEADFLISMSTVQHCKSFRSINRGSIFIQELCQQLQKSAESSENDDILTVLTRVNREVGRKEYETYKQMPQPRYTLTKKLVFRYVR